MTPEPAVHVIAHAIQLAVAPVFLLTGIAALLGVVTNRLSRVIDRARWLEAAWPGLDQAQRQEARRETEALERRRHYASWSINFSAAAALLICIVIVVLFAEEFFGVNLRIVSGVLFVIAMFALIGGLFSFLREVYLATHSLHIDPAKFKE